MQTQWWVGAAYGAMQGCKRLRQRLLWRPSLPSPCPWPGPLYPPGYEYLQTLLCIHSDAELERFMHGELHLGLDVTLMAGADLPRHAAASAAACCLLCAGAVAAAGGAA